MRKYFYILALFLFASTAYGQLNIMLRAGYGLQSRRDSALVWSINAATLRTIVDSLRIVVDTVTTDNQSMTFTGSDTASWYFWRDFTIREDGAYRYLQVIQATSDWAVHKIAITHEYDHPTAGYLDRDTLYVHPSDYATIPRGSHVFLAYLPASSYTRTSQPKASQECQQVGIYFVRPNSPGVVEIGADRVQIPLLLGVSTPLGIAGDHILSVTVTFKTKVP